MIYTANYGQYEPSRWQPVPVALYTDESHPLDIVPEHYPREWHTTNRLRAKFWKVFPEQACPGSEVTVWIDGSMTVLDPDLEAKALAELGDDDALFMRHPWRDCIYEERDASHPNAKYDGQPTQEQVDHYRAEGHPEHWGLVHSGLLVRRDTPAMRAFDAAWWSEILRWSVQDQLSLPYLLRTLPLRWHYWPIDPITAGQVRWGMFNA